jgi:hypothetical protein
VAKWLQRNPRVTLHFTPTSGSWLNMVEIFFSIITRQAIRRGSYCSVKELITAISGFIDGWNERCHPFVWTKPADQLLDHYRPGQRTSLRDTSTLAARAPLTPLPEGKCSSPSNVRHNAPTCTDNASAGHVDAVASSPAQINPTRSP